MVLGPISAFLQHNFRHFNAAALLEAANAYKQHLDNGGMMLITLAGAMSTGELGISLGRMIRERKVHAICCTGANLEEDVFNLIAHNSYQRISNYRNLSAADELLLYEHDLNRVTDTCIPEHEAIRRLEHSMLEEWATADKLGERYFPHDLLLKVLREGKLKDAYDIDVQDSWVHAAMEVDLPIFVPGWEDSTLGNLYAAHCMMGDIKSVSTVKSGLEYLMELGDWYEAATAKSSFGFFQIGGGITGDFAVSIVPMLREDMKRQVPLWGYFCQISDSTMSYGSYSGAPPNEKITWGKLGPDTPKFIIESDASIVAPLIFAVVLGC
jgi:deoxyhypusine synthase